MMLISALIALASTRFINAIHHSEIYIRTKPGFSVERLANAIHPMGRLESRLRGTHVFLVQLNAGVDDKDATKRLATIPGVHPLDADEEPVDMTSIESLSRKIDHLGDDDEPKASPDKRIEKDKGDYLKAYRYFINQRAFPKDKVNWDGLANGWGHAAQMKPTLFDSYGADPTSQNLWSFVGPTNLAVPYNPYYGIGPINGRVNALAYDPNNAQIIYAAGAQGGVWKSTNSGANWTWLSASWNQLGVNQIVVDPTNSATIYACLGDYHGYLAGSYGIMKSTEGGVTWTEIASASLGQVGVAKLLIDPTNSQTLIAGTGDVGHYGFLYRSTDGGQTWTILQVGGTDFLWPALAASVPSNGAVRFYAVAAGIATSTGVSSRVYSSDDHGQTWKLLASPISKDGSIHYAYCVATSPTNPNAVYVLDSENTRLITSTNKGATWTDQSGNLPLGSNSYNFSQSYYDYHLECGNRVVGTTNTDILFLGQIDLTESVDGGNSWTSIGGPTYDLNGNAISHNDQHCLAVCPTNPNLAVFSNDGGVYSLSYNSATGRNAVSPLNRYLGNTMFYKVAFHPSNANIMLGGTQDNATPISRGDLANWLNVAGGDGGGCAINRANPLIQYATIDGFLIYKTTDGWNTSSLIKNGASANENSPFVTALTLDPQNQYLMYSATNYLYRYDETQQQWSSALGGQDLTDKTSKTAVVQAIAVSPTDQKTIYTGSNDGAVYMTKDQGATWTELSKATATLPKAAITSITVSPTNPNDILVGYSGTGRGISHLFRCTNTTSATVTFIGVSGSGGSGLPDVSLNAISRDIDNPASTWYVGTDVGVFQTANSGQTWTNAGATLGLPNVIVDDLVAVSGTRYLNAGTYGRGLWRLQIPPQAIVPSLTNLTVAPSSIAAGTQATGTVTLSSSAPSGGLVVSLSSTNTSAATVSSSVTVPAGATSATFAISGNPSLSATASVTINATQGNATFSLPLKVVVLGLSGLSLSPATVSGGNFSTGTVTLSVAASGSGSIVNLSSDNLSAVVPASVTVPSGATTATFQVATTSVNTTTYATISASMGTSLQKALLTINPPALTSISVSPTTVAGGNSSIGTVLLTGSAPIGGMLVSLSSSNVAATVPASVFVGAGFSTATFTVNTVAVSSSVVAAISGTLNGVTVSANLKVSPPSLSGITLAPSQVFGSTSSTATLTLNGPVGPGGLQVSLKSSNVAATVPATVTIPTGVTTGTFTVTTSTVDFSATSTISATLAGITQSATLTIDPLSVAGLSISPNAVVGGNSATGTVTLNAPAPVGGFSVFLRSSLAWAIVPANVTVPAGSSSATFTIQTTKAYYTDTATITAGSGVTVVYATLAVQIPMLSSIAVLPTEVVGGNIAGGSVILARQAPAGGVTVSLSSTAGGSVPPSLFVPAGSSIGTFRVTTSGVASSTQVMISASLDGVTQSTSLTLTPAGLYLFLISPQAVRDGASSTGTIYLSGAAPTGGLVATVTSSSVDAKAPATVTIPAGASSVDFTITTLPVVKETDVTLTVKLGTLKGTNPMRLLPPAVTAITLSTSSVVGSSTAVVNGTVTLSAPPVAAYSVILSSADKKAVTVPASVLFKAGAVTATFKVSHLRVSAATNAGITASAGGVSQSATLMVNPFVVTSMTATPSSVIGGADSIGTVTLNAVPASAAVVVKLASSSTAVKLPLSASVAVGMSSESFTITTTAVSSPVTASVTGTYDSSSASTTVSVQVPTLLSVAVSPTAVRGVLATVVTGTVKLTGPAPVGGMVVSLSSSASCATVPATVTILAGRTSATFSVKHSKVTASTPATVTATQGGLSASAVLTVNP